MDRRQLQMVRALRLVGLTYSPPQVMRLFLKEFWFAAKVAIIYRKISIKVAIVSKNI
jgi:hypothetical protein